jgi:hypothetical protein
VKARGKHGNQLAEISGYIGKRREIEGSKSVPAGSSVEQNDPPVLIGSHTQLSEPVGDKDTITSLAQERAFCASLGKDRAK